MRKKFEERTRKRKSMISHWERPVLRASMYLKARGEECGVCQGNEGVWGGETGCESDQQLLRADLAEGNG